MYWRLLSTDATAAKGIVMGDRPPVNTDTDRMELGALDQLLLHTGTLGSIYHKTPEVCNLTSFILDAYSDIIDFHSICKGQGVNG